MGWSDDWGYDKVQFDLDALERLYKNITGTVENLTALSDSLVGSLETLRKDWDTPNGRKFFEELDDGWQEEVNKYVATLESFQVILVTARLKYAQILEKARELQIESG